MNLQDYLQNTGLLFDKNNVIDLYLALKSNPLVIFTGISGSGKTKLGQSFVEYMSIATHTASSPAIAPTSPLLEPHKYRFVSVRSDWLDNNGLLGYNNPLLGIYSSTPAIELILDAHNEPTEPFFLILDEMNLAKAEYYFSDFLSAIESRKYSPITGKIESEFIELHKSGEKLLTKSFSTETEKQDALTEMRSLPDDKFVNVSPSGERTYYVPEKVTIPPNLYIIGTVNIDETTYRFSPKVIDRANVIEMNGAHIDDYLTNMISGTHHIGTNPYYDHLLFSVNDFTYVRGFYSTKSTRDILTDPLINQHVLQEAIKHIWGLLEDTQFRFSYRTTNNLINYIYNGVELAATSAITPNDTVLLYFLDSSFLLKILPRLHGQRRQMEELLINLLYFCHKDFKQVHYDEIKAGSEKISDFSGLENAVFNSDNFRFPRSAERIKRVLTSLIETNYGSFI
ncbi:McrB family protein [Lysinibacillus capsici]|uniref:McrB family protein n=1 Tax=Lysinibacillus capsici TaxID=2115968 RepID=UPI0034E3E9BC